MSRPLPSLCDRRLIVGALDAESGDAEAPAVRRLNLDIESRWGSGQMAVLDFGDPNRPVDLVFVHANGFNAATYRALLGPLSASMRIWAPDLRGHGRTSLPTNMAGRWNWADHRDDLMALLDQIKGPPVALAGHSMGGTVSLLAAAKRPERVSRLVLFDPVILPRSAVLAFQMPLLRRLPVRMPLVKGALKRRPGFDSREQAKAAYLGRGAFKGWPEVMLDDYLSEGLVERPSSAGGGVVLACAPDWEASNYAAQSHDPWRALSGLHRPVHILRAEFNSTCDPTVGQHLPGVTVETVSKGTHFFPMLRQDIAARALAGG